MTLGERAILLCGTGLMVGKIPVAPGTFGTAAGIPLCLALALLPPLPALLVLAAFILLAVWIADRSGRLLGAADPGCVVIDEVAGILATLYALPPSWPVVGAGFVLFRLFDITKPFPIGRLERLPGGIGVVADDVAAGVAANLVLRSVLALAGG